MAFTVEDGTGLAAANSYASVATVTAYLADRARDATWTAATQAAQEAALVEATDYVEARFRSRWRGIKKLSTQALSWPRNYAVDDDGNTLSSTEVPALLEYAIAEYATRALSATLLSDPAAPETGTQGPVTATRETVGPITVAKAFSAYGGGNSGAGRGLVADTAIPQYPAGDLLIAGLINSGGSVFGRVVRA